MSSEAPKHPEGEGGSAASRNGSAPEAERPAGPGGPDDVHGVADATLGGYFETHDRPPAFHGPDGHPYTVSIEVDRTPDLRAPYQGYLVFPRWAETGLGIVGHVETPTLWEGTSRDAVVEEAGDTTLLRVKELLDEAIRRTRADSADEAEGPKGT